MKKILLPLLAVASLPAFAQNVLEVARPDAQSILDAQISAGKAELVLNNKNQEIYTANDATGFEGLKLAETANVTANIYSDNKYLLVTASAGDYKQIRFNGSDDFAFTVDEKEYSLQGQNNGDQPTLATEEKTKPFSTMSSGTWLDFTRSGCQFSFQAKQKGWLYVVNKISSNKNYYVAAIKNNENGSEGLIGTANAVSYQVAGLFEGLTSKLGENTDKSIVSDNDVMNYTLPYDKNVYPFYTVKAFLPWPEQIAQGSQPEYGTVYTTEGIKNATTGATTGTLIPKGSEIYDTYAYAYENAERTGEPVTLNKGTVTEKDYYTGLNTDGAEVTCTIVKSKTDGYAWSTKSGSAKLSGLGVIGFEVLPGYTYVVMARGSKLTFAGYAFSNKALKIEVGKKIEAAEEGAEATWEWTTINDKETFEVAPTAITTPIADIVNDGAAYNLAGQRINGSAKGIVIKNGKKYLVK